MNLSKSNVGDWDVLSKDISLKVGNTELDFGLDSTLSKIFVIITPIPEPEPEPSVGKSRAELILSTICVVKGDLIFDLGIDELELSSDIALGIPITELMGLKSDIMLKSLVIPITYVFGDIYDVINETIYMEGTLKYPIQGLLSSIFGKPRSRKDALHKKKKLKDQLESISSI